VIIAVDFDGVVVVRDGRKYSDVRTPLKFVPGAKEGLASLKRAKHVLLLWSARSNRALLEDPQLDPLVRSGITRVDLAAWRAARPLHLARRDQMLTFVGKELPGVFDAIDDGCAGKPNVDLFLDDKAMRFGATLRGSSWKALAEEFGVLVKKAAVR